MIPSTFIPQPSPLLSRWGKLASFHSIRINDQWRIVFRWTESGPAEVAIRDYH